MLEVALHFTEPKPLDGRMDRLELGAGPSRWTELGRVLRGFADSRQCDRRRILQKPELLCHGTFCQVYSQEFPSNRDRGGGRNWHPPPRRHFGAHPGGTHCRRPPQQVCSSFLDQSKLKSTRRLIV